MNHYDFIGVLWIVLSIGLFYVTFWMLSTGILESELYSVMGQLATFENQYFLLFFFTTAYILIEYGVKILDGSPTAKAYPETPIMPTTSTMKKIQKNISVQDLLYSIPTFSTLWFLASS